MSVFFVILGIFFGWIGIDNFKNAEEKGRTTNNSAGTWRVSGAVCVISAIVIIGCGIFIGSLGDVGGSGGSSGHKCAICGKSGGRQITNSAGDYYYYCSEHYADAWQYYYGK